MTPSPFWAWVVGVLDAARAVAGRHKQAIAHDAVSADHDPRICPQCRLIAALGDD